VAISDVTRPYYGESEAIFDGWLSYSALRPLAAWPDGTVVQWTIREPQRWTLTNTFSF
jgi:hypothetical protein